MKVYSNTAWSDLGSGAEPGQLPTYTTVERDALSPSAGLMIYNTDYDQVQTYTQTAWSGITGNKDLGIECASAMDCASGFCVDSVCCDTSLDNCSGDCEACNLAGTIGYCTVRSELDNTEVTSTCHYCNGVSNTSVAYTGNAGVNCSGINGCSSGICQNSYCDEDNDTYYSLTPVECVSGRYSFAVGNDCCDSDNRAYPNETTYYTTINNCGSWDYDCSESISKSNCQQTTACSTWTNNYTVAASSWSTTFVDCGTTWDQKKCYCVANNYCGNPTTTGYPSASCPCYYAAIETWLGAQSGGLSATATQQATCACR